MFPLFLNDLFRVLDWSRISAFAGDVEMLWFGKQQFLYVLETTIYDDLDYLVGYMVTNCLRVSTDKMKAMVFFDAGCRPYRYHVYAMLYTKRIFRPESCVHGMP